MVHRYLCSGSQIHRKQAQLRRMAGCHLRVIVFIYLCSGYSDLQKEQRIFLKWGHRRNIFGHKKSGLIPCHSHTQLPGLQIHPKPLQIYIYLMLLLSLCLFLTNKGYRALGLFLYICLSFFECYSYLGASTVAGTPGPISHRSSVKPSSCNKAMCCNAYNNT